MQHFGQLRYTEGNGKYVALLSTRLLDMQWHEKGNKPTSAYVIIRGDSDDIKYVGKTEDWDDTTYAELTEELKTSNPELFLNGKIRDDFKKESQPERHSKARNIFRAKEKTREEFATYGIAEKAYCGYCLEDCGKARKENFGILRGEVYE